MLAQLAASRPDVMDCDRETQSYEFDWDGISISVTYAPDWLSITSKYGVAAAHLKIEAIKPKRAPLPMSETGFRSLFSQKETIKAGGGPVAYALAWLDAEAKNQAQ